MDARAAGTAGGTVRFELDDPHGRLSEVRLVQELGLDPAPFVRVGPRWQLALERPDVDRLEYLFEVRDHNGNRATLTDPANPLRAPGAFGEKSVLELPGYRPPAWLLAPGVEADTDAFELDAEGLDAPITGTLWTPAGLTGPAPLLLVHDGPEFAALGGFTQYLSASIASGDLPPLRAALLAPGDRNVRYSADDAYADAVAGDVLSALPSSTVRVGIGVSLGALAMLHLHRRHPRVLDALLLQSGSFFTPDLDAQESGFSGYAAVTAFVASVHAASYDDHPVPVAITCGRVEENLANNRSLADTLTRLEYPTSFTAVPDAHNYTAWRDALHPVLTGLIASLGTAHAA